MKRQVLTIIALMMSLAVKAGTVYVGGEYTQATIGRYIVIASADENGVLDYDASLPARKAVYGSPVYCRWNVGTNLADITPQGFASNVTDVDNRTRTLILPTQSIGLYYRAFSNFANLETIIFKNDDYGFTRALMTYTPGASSPDNGKSVSCVFEGLQNVKKAVFAKEPPQYSTGLIGSQIFTVTESVYFPASCSNQWQKLLRNIGYNGMRVSYEGTWPNITPVCVNGLPVGYVPPPNEVTNYVHTIVTNVIHTMSEVTNVVEHFSTVTNVIEHEHHTTVTNVVRYVPEPGTSPAPAYHINAGTSGDLQIAGAAGWDAYGVPDGMTWNRETGALEGAAVKSGVYDLILVSGSGTETKIMRTTLEVKGYATVVGHVGVVFSKSGAPVNCLKSYKTLPAGLKWDAKKKVLSGIPTKAQTLSYETVYGDPVTIEIKPAETTMAGTYNGMIGYRVEEGEGDSWHAIGNMTVTAAATGKLSAKVVVPQGTYNFPASAWDSVADGIYRVNMSTKAGDKLCVVLDTTTDWKSARIISQSSFQIAKDANTYIVSAWRNEHGKTDAIAKDPVASEFISRIKALKKMYLKATKVDDDHYTLEAQTASKGADVTLTFNANGTVAYSGKVGSTKVSGTSTLTVSGESYFTIFDLVVPVSKTRAMYFAMGFDKGEGNTPDPDFEIIVSDIKVNGGGGLELRGVQLWENGPYWAECNVGATKPEEYGYYFWWGDIVGYTADMNNATPRYGNSENWDGITWVSSTGTRMSSSPFTSLACLTYGKDNSQLQSAGYIDATGNLVAAHDAATAHLGAPWRMPTDAEMSALISNCDTTWTTQGGVYGRLVKGRGAYASKSIFLPAAGLGSDSHLNMLGSYGYYWSAPCSGISYYAWYFFFYSGNIGWHDDCRDYGQSVRAVRGFAK